MEPAKQKPEHPLVNRHLKVFALNKLIGVAEIIGIDDGMGIAFGKFKPNETYAEYQPIFRLFTLAISGENEQVNDTVLLAEYFAKRDTLELTCKDENNQQLSTGWIHIIDLSEELDDYEIEIKLNQI